MDPAYRTAFVRLLGQALELDSSERATFLDRVCKDDPTLRNLLTSVLDDPPPDGFLTTDELGVVYSNDFDLIVNGVPAVVGAYRLQYELGRGGMGTVYLAERAEADFVQRVAIKLARFATVDPKRMLRFRAERRILARMDHPNIARLLDGGLTERGVPYLAMEYVDGRPIDRYCVEENLDLEARLRLFKNVCGAVQYAHRKLVVHRDLKPSNILITDEGVVKLLDFGIAKLLESEDEFLQLTQTGGGVMTPAYASPEQVRGEPITTATDVYTLGVLLYHLLTGTLPHVFESQRPQEIERVVCEVIPTLPSQALRSRLTGDTSNRVREQQIAPRLLEGELDTIILMALRKEAEARYVSAEAFATDIERYLANEPVQAHRPSKGYRARKFIVRNARTLAVAAVLVISLGVALSQSFRAREERRDFEAQFDASLGWLETLDPISFDRSDKTTVDILDNQVELASLRYSNNPIKLARFLTCAGRIYNSLGLYDTAITLHLKSIKILDLNHNSGTILYHSLLHDLGLAFFNINNLSKADSLFNSALADIRLKGTESDSLEALLYAGLSNVLIKQGKSDSAEVLAALATDKASENPSFWLLVDIRHRLASAQLNSGHIVEAESMLTDQIKQLRELRMADHILFADHLNSLALLLVKRYEKDFHRPHLEKASVLLDEAVNILRPRLRSGHPLLANTLHSKGYLLTYLSKYQEAEPLLRESASIYKQHIDKNHPLLVGVLSNLGYSLSAQGKTEAAFDAYMDVYNRTVEQVGKFHTRSASLLLQMAFLLEKTHLDSSYSNTLTSLNIFRDNLTNGHPEIQRALMQLSKLEMKRGFPEKAEPMLREVLGYRLADLPDGDWRIGSTQSFLGESLMLQGKFEEAEPLLFEGYETMRAVRGEHDEKVQLALDRIQRFDEKRRRFATAASG